MKHLQKSLSLFLCIILCLSFFPFSAAYAEESDVIEEEPAIQNNTVLEGQEEIPVAEEIVDDSENQPEDSSLTVEGEGSFDAAEGIVHSGTWGELNWTLDDVGTLTISGSGPMNSFSYQSAEAWHAYKTEIKEVIIASGVTSIGTFAFDDYKSLSRVIIPESVIIIYNAAFRGCSSLEKIIIPNGVKVIGADCFEGCSSLTSVNIPSSVTELNAFIFANCTNLTSITVDPANSVYCDLDGVLYTKNTTIIWQVPGAWSGEYLIPDGVTRIMNGAFFGCSNLTSVTIPGSVTDIGFSAFYGCSSLTKVTIPNGVNSIANYTFLNCNSLTSVTFSESVTSIGEYVFSNSLTDIYYGGTQEQWNQISLGKGNESLTTATIHFEVKNGLVQDDDGVFRYYENDIFVPLSGIVDYHGGSFFVANGVLCSDANGLAEYGGQWYFLANGQVQKQYSGLAQYDGEWFYIENGILNISKNGLVFYDGGQFLVAIGRICYDVSGLWLNSANIGGDNRW